MIKSISNRYSFILLFLFVFLYSNAQINYPGEPLFKPYSDTNFVPLITINVDDGVKQKNQVNDAVNYKVDEFATPVQVSINPTDFGVWINFQNINKKAWLLRIKSENAISLNFLFDKYKLLPGAKVFLYDRGQNTILGAFTHRNNKPWGRLATSLIKSDEVYIELQMPLSQENFGEFNIGKVSVEKGEEKINRLKSIQDWSYGLSAPCNVNVNCYNEAHIQNQKKAVCRVLYDGGYRCTGTLLNNLTNDGTPYVLTARHCFSSDEIAEDAVFSFNYESSGCENMDAILESVSGANVVSTSFSYDFTLLRLSENVPIKYEPLYSGWDATNVAPKSTYSIHHPLGDIKKISINNDEATSWGGDAFWFINEYEEGYTEHGSSGCGLVSENNLVVGVLHGGDTGCGFPMHDKYQKFSSIYNGYPNPENQLKVWLDPLNTNKIACPYYYPLDLKNTAEKLTNISEGDVVKTVVSNSKWGYLSGHNYQYNTLFAEYIQLRGSKYLYGVNMELAVPNYNAIGNEGNLISIWEGGAKPGKMLYETPVNYSEVKDEDGNLKLELEFDSTILVHNSFYIGYKISYNSDFFAVKTAATNEQMNSAFTYLNNEWTPLQIDAELYPSKLAIEVLAFDLLPDKNFRPDTNSLSQVNIYPNPSESQFQVYFKNKLTGKVLLKIYDLSGNPVYSKQLYNPDKNVQIIHNLPKGMYIFNVSTENSNIGTHKLLVI